MPQCLYLKLGCFDIAFFLIINIYNSLQRKRRGGVEVGGRSDPSPSSQERPYRQDIPFTKKKKKKMAKQTRLWAK